jgi:hypothetical protein
MTSADHYRTLAAQCDAKAKQEADWKIRAEWEHMTRSYHRLAEQAERNARTDVTYETPLRRPAASPPAQHQQQPQAKGNPEVQSKPENDP